tara:strand:+ start:4687 stop:4926 length:240 start_codon:yes stop_codon:yes gene_type:complete
MGRVGKQLLAQSYVENPRELRFNKRVTKNDKKAKKSVYSSKYIRLVLKHLSGKITNAREGKSIDRENVRSPEIGRVAQS